MNKRMIKRSLVTATVLVVIGIVGTEAYSAQDRDCTKDQVSAKANKETVIANEIQDPWQAIRTDMIRMQAQMDKLMDSALHDMPTLGLENSSTQPQVTLEEQGDKYVVKANIPGVNENNININLNGRFLSLSSDSQSTEKQTSDSGKVTQQERYVSHYQQAFTLPGPVNAAGMNTKFQDNSVTITIPKATS
jgi:HSP20 family protein